MGTPTKQNVIDGQKEIIDGLNVRLNNLADVERQLAENVHLVSKLTRENRKLRIENDSLKSAQAASKEQAQADYKHLAETARADWETNQRLVIELRAQIAEADRIAGQAVEDRRERARTYNKALLAAQGRIIHWRELADGLIESLATYSELERRAWIDSAPSKNPHLPEPARKKLLTSKKEDTQC